MSTPRGSRGRSQSQSGFADRLARAVGPASRVLLCAAGLIILEKPVKPDRVGADEHEMIVANYMTKNVFTIRADRALLIAGEVMTWANCRHVPVVDADDELVGLITHRDLLNASLSSLEAADATGSELERREHLAHLAIGDVMVTDVVTIDPKASIKTAARVMRRGKYGCLPVVDSHNRLLGILTEFDLLGILEHIDLGATSLPQTH